MVVDSEKSGPQWSNKNDPRITKVGRIIRKLRIDELPQIISVIKGDMSLIGPRPERPVFEKEIKKKIKFYNIRHLVKPGLSGWAQVNYPYGASIKDTKYKHTYDLYGHQGPANSIIKTNDLEASAAAADRCYV